MYIFSPPRSTQGAEHRKPEHITSKTFSHGLLSSQKKVRMNKQQFDHEKLKKGNSTSPTSMFPQQRRQLVPDGIQWKREAAITPMKASTLTLILTLTRDSN